MVGRVTLALTLLVSACPAFAEEFDLAAHWAPYPAPLVPADNPITAEKVELGRRLFNDTRLSITGEFSCASCHQPDTHFVDSRTTAVGATGQSHSRNTPSLYNSAFNASFGWTDQGLTSLEAQHKIPLLNDDPIEMGFQPREGLPGLPTIVAAIASYARTIRAPESAFDRFLFKDEQDAMSDAAKRGLDLFFSERLGCSHCHASFNFSGPISHVRETAPPVFHVMGVSGSREAFRAPSLRQVKHTAPYMHDGSVATLPDVIAHYQELAPNHARVPDFTLDAAEVRQLVAFLETL